MPREITNLDGTAWTTTRVAPTRNAPFAGLAGARWTTTRPQTTHNAPFAGLGYWDPAFAAVEQQPTPAPAGKVKGLVARIRYSGNKKISMNQFGALYMPLFRDNDLEAIEIPQLVVDDNPVWVWRLEDVPQDGKAASAKIWSSYIASGPFAGMAGAFSVGFECTTTEPGDLFLNAVCKDLNSPPTLKDTAELPRYVEEWSVVLRPTNLEAAEGKVAVLRNATRVISRELRKATEGGVSPSLSLVDVEANRGGGGGGGLATAAAIGIGLLLLSLGSSR